MIKLSLLLFVNEIAININQPISYKLFPLNQCLMVHIIIIIIPYIIKMITI